MFIESVDEVNSKSDIQTPNYFLDAIKWKYLMSLGSPLLLKINRF